MKTAICLLCFVIGAQIACEETKPPGEERSQVSVKKEKTGIWIEKEGARKWLSNEQIVDHFIETITLRDKIEESLRSMARSAVQREEILRQRQQTITDLVPESPATLHVGMRHMSWTGPLDWAGTQTMVVDWIRVEPIPDSVP